MRTTVRKVTAVAPRVAHPKAVKRGLAAQATVDRLRNHPALRVMLRVSKVRDPRQWRHGIRHGCRRPDDRGEQVAILDRQLEESTRDFDGIIYDEEQRQREAARERAAQTAQTAGSAIDPTESEEPNFGGGMASAGSGSVGGGIGGRSGAPPADGAKYPPPPDIPNGNDDDVVARQLREAAMREPDPAIREKLWAEYRKYKGIEEPDS
jgi:hypothetical protein